MLGRRLRTGENFWPKKPRSTLCTLAMILSKSPLVFRVPLKLTEETSLISLFTELLAVPHPSLNVSLAYLSLNMSFGLPNAQC